GTERARAEDPSGRVESVPVPRPMPKPKPRVLSLAGRSGNGEWVTSRGTTYFTYEFQAGGRVVYRSNRETLTGSWTQNGNSVTVLLAGQRPCRRQAQARAAARRPAGVEWIEQMLALARRHRRPTVLDDHLDAPGRLFHAHPDPAIAAGRLDGVLDQAGQDRLH